MKFTVLPSTHRNFVLSSCYNAYGSVLYITATKQVEEFLPQFSSKTYERVLPPLH